MKNLSTKTLLTFILMAMPFFQLLPQSVSIPEVIAMPSTETLVPVNIGNLENIGAISLYISYNPSVLEFIDVTNLSPEAEGALANSLVIGGTTYLGLSWLAAGSQGIDFPDGKLLDVRFLYIEGASSLEFSSMCEIADWEANPIIVTYSNGMVSSFTGSAVSIWNGTGTWDEAANWSNGLPGSSTRAIIQTGELHLESGSSIKTLVVENIAKFIIGCGGFLTVSDSLSIAGEFSILSSESGTGSLIHSDFISITGQVNIENFMTGGDQDCHLASSPVSGTTTTVYLPASVETYIESTQSWQTMGVNDPLAPAMGFKVSPPANTTFVFHGDINSLTSFQPVISYTSGGQTYPDGLNLIGNPFPSAIDWDHADWIKTGIYGSVYSWNGTNYVAWNGETGNLRDGIIPAMQGFFTVASGGNAQLIIPGSARVHSEQEYYKEAKETENLLVLSFGNEEERDETFIQFKPGTTTGFDDWADAFKLPGAAHASQLFSLSQENIPLAINLFPQPVSNDSSISIGYRVNSQGQYSIRRENYSIYTKPLYLKDLATGDTVDLKSDSIYTFQSDAGEFTDRLKVFFMVPPSAVAESYRFEGEVFYSCKSLIIRQDLPGRIYQVMITDLTGRTQMISETDGRSYNRLPVNLSRGIYFATLQYQGRQHSFKIGVN